MKSPRRLLAIRPRVANASETAAYIGVSLSKLDVMKKSGEFPITRLHYGKYYDLNAVDAWLDKIGGLGKPHEDHESAWLKHSHG